MRPGASSGAYETLLPRQELTSVPYANFALDAGMLDGLDSGQLYTKAQVDALLVEYDDRIDALEDLLASVSLENGGQDFVFENVNVHIRSGSGATDGAVNGRGNLIVGYNEDAGSDAYRAGSHNLVVGPEHSYASYGGFVAGYENTVSGPFASVSGGLGNYATGEKSSIGGGQANQANGSSSSVSGGNQNIAYGQWSSISGGSDNMANGFGSSISGGLGNHASGDVSTIGGGHNVSVGDVFDWAAGDLFQDE